jgi:hypothetical protein
MVVAARKPAEPRLWAEKRVRVMRRAILRRSRLVSGDDCRKCSLG